MEYKLIVHEGSFRYSDEDVVAKFEAKVNKMIKEGWIPQGGFYYNAKDFMFVQAMIRKTPE